MDSLDHWDIPVAKLVIWSLVLPVRWKVIFLECASFVPADQRDRDKSYSLAVRAPGLGRHPHGYVARIRFHPCRGTRPGAGFLIDDES